MTEIMPVPRNLILLSYQQGALDGCFFVLRLHSFRDLVFFAPLEGTFCSDKELRSQKTPSTYP